jgi:hypothetical protein
VAWVGNELFSSNLNLTEWLRCWIGASRHVEDYKTIINHIASTGVDKVGSFDHISFSDQRSASLTPPSTEV